MDTEDPLHLAAAAAQHHRHHNAVQLDRDLRQLRHRADSNRGRAGQYHSCLCDLCLPGGHQFRQHPDGGGCQPVHLPDPRRVFDLHPARRRAAGKGGHLMSGVTLTAGTIRTKPRGRPPSLKRERRWALWGSYIALIFFAIGFLIPPYFELATALKTSQEIGSGKDPWYPAHPYLGNFLEIIRNPHFQTFFFNTVKLTLVVVVVTL